MDVDRLMPEVMPTSPGSMRRYYAQRAASYEQVYAKAERQADLRAIEAWLPHWFAGRQVLEVACGTGWWAPHGAKSAVSWLATDANPEMIEIARTKPLPERRVQFALTDAYTLAELGTARFDGAFAGFWWSHVPVKQLRGWLDALHARLQRGAPVVILDNRFVEGSSTPITRRDAHGNTYQTRPQPDGSTHEVMKNFPTEAEVRDALGLRARGFRWHQWPHYWACTYEAA